MIFKSLLTLLTVLLSTGAGLAQKEPSFPHSMTEHAMKKQYIVQFKHDSDFQLAKTATTKDKKIQVLRNMDKIQTGVYKFKSNGAAQRWRKKNADSIKFFEKGEKINIHFDFIIRRSSPLWFRYIFICTSITRERVHRIFIILPFIFPNAFLF